jgi:penicillin-binding protein 1A
VDRRLDQDPAPDIARRGRHRHAQRRRHGLRTVVASVLIGGLTLSGTGLAAMVLWVDEVSAGIDISTMPEHLPGVNSTILDAHGNQLARVASTENRIPEPASRISPWLVRATIAIEDRRFYQHGGVDYQATLRALAGWYQPWVSHVRN